MAIRYVGILAWLALFAMVGCAGRGSKMKEELLKSPCNLAIVFGGYATPLPGGAKREDPHWVRIKVTISDSSYDFGYLNDRGNFIRSFTGAEGSFEGLGGLYYPFALRATTPDRTVYPMNAFGGCRLTGETIDGAKAIKPALNYAYRSGARIVFSIPDKARVAVTLSATPPNGFIIE
ncbi:MAG: hypothetical protein GTO51_07995 [Candidatus Latescibacteria bacterium]|nr:hypothetical protein [Candidatus Latescibacterota bacterium]NIM21775.1 hypothetical protein [Candidatus Latescibacterota bacterium]NIM65913.1 hypothetical protein [Candidatus Latescibacterota bacterium]NIO02658.1 hypothetical protein [Candidatus Latescibacterota bacterium]NIO29639.1 hypothetical protein [Candidatus Latescibacterota bacterium]